MEIMEGAFARFSIVEMAKVSGNLKTLVLGCSTSMSAVVEVINRCDRLESLECTDVIANVTALWDPERPKSLRRLLLAAKGSTLLQLRLVSFETPINSCISLTVVYVPVKIIRTIARIARVGTPRLDWTPPPTGFLHPQRP